MKNKREILVLFLCVLTFSSIYSQVKFPESQPQLGYNFSNVHARVALPLDGNNRIWIKGSKNYNKASIISASGNVETSIILEPPFYTTTINVTESEVIAKFCDKNSNCIETEKLYPSYFNETKAENFSIMLYGCMEPFMVESKEGKPISTIFEGKDNSSTRMRQLFKNVALHNSLKFSDSIKDADSLVFRGIKDSTLLKYAPKLIITTGDQVYVDAGYDTKVGRKEIHPISAWQTKRRPHPYDTSRANYFSHLNKLYNASYSFDDLEAAHKKLPTLATIDDHEIRDGWGSQGDEYDKVSMNKELSDFYRIGKKAFIDHQLNLPSFTTEKLDSLGKSTSSMHYAFNVHGINGFVLDLRSSRNINENTVLGENQWQDFEHWLDNLEKDQEVIIVTSIPLTLKPLKFFENMLKLIKPELRDDVRDGWSYRKNVEDRDRLLRLLTSHRIKRSIKPIFVSGDVHKSALIEIWVDPYADKNGTHDVLETMILGYEIVASGLSHEFIKTGLSKSLFKITESQRIGDGFIEFEYNGNGASIYPMVRKSVVAQNFGAIEFSRDELTKLHIFNHNSSDNTLNQFYLELDFNKKLPDNDYYIVRKIREDKIKREFVPPIPHGKRTIINE